MNDNSTRHKIQLLFGKHIESLRVQQNLSYRQLAQRCDIDHSDISKIEKGERNIQLTTIIELAKALQVEPKKLLDFELDIDIEIIK